MDRQSKLAVEVVEGILDDIGSAIKTIGALLDEYGPGPTPHSQAAIDIAKYPDYDCGKNPYALGGQQIEHVADHLMAFRRTVTEHVMTVAPWNCVRAALECAALACWLIAEGQNSEVRVQRALGYRYASLNEGLKLYRAIGNANAIIKSELALDRLEDQAVHYKLAVKTKNGNRTGVGIPPLLKTAMAKEMLNAEVEYRLLSAMTHGQHWASMALGFKRVQGEDGPLLEKHMPLWAVPYLAQVGFKAFCTPLLMKLRSYGWPEEPAQSIMDEVSAKLAPYEIKWE
jgi:hypothetical protein